MDAADQYEEAEEVDVVERRFILKRHRRQKYRCGCGGCVETALGPPELQRGGRYSLDPLDAAFADMHSGVNARGVVVF
ncbi:hypothetical protein G4177_06870 [Corallococcus sp. ZKHCc1 1396]|uniref:Transposase IS66 zinc-finger binding domain-containing protein n=1 Tax=Corallococcus soli TaxID=2710757 RepID=A0ABR9PIZ2_9BACT|nr:IS66 family transposase zinc-finger binding domain-containing protein [Corallococcus soli]MBE4747901.1 hypothetical protein [Corallococcus soli]